MPLSTHLSVAAMAPTPAANTITTIAGGGFGCAGQADSLGDGCPATQARMLAPSGAVVDSAGNVYVADTGDNVVRKISADGSITTTAGTGTAGDNGDGGPAAQAQLNGPAGLAMDNAGNLFIADAGNNAIRVVNLATGIIATIAGTGSAGYSGDGGLAAVAQLDHPMGVAVDPQGQNLYIADTDNNVVREMAITASATITTVAGTGTAGYSGDVGGYGEGTPTASTDAELNHPQGILVTWDGTLYIADTQNNAVRMVFTPYCYALPCIKNITTFVGTGGYNIYNQWGYPYGSTALNQPTAIIQDHAGGFYIADSGDHIVREVTGFSGVASGQIFTVAGTGTDGDSGDGGPPTSAQLDAPTGIAFGGGGQLFIVDAGSNVVRDAALVGITYQVAGNNAMQCYNSDPDPCFGGDGGPATQAQFDEPQGAVADAAGNVYIADNFNNRIREVMARTGIITTVVGGGSGCAGQIDAVGDGCSPTQATLSSPSGIAIDNAGNLYIPDCGDNVVREVSGGTGGTITTIAGTGSAGDSGDGGPATSATLSCPVAIALDSIGNLYISDSGNNAVRKVDAQTGVITTLYTNATYPPNGLAVDRAGHVFVAGGSTNEDASYYGTIEYGDHDAITELDATGHPIATFAEPDNEQDCNQIVNYWGVAVDGAGNAFFSDTISGNVMEMVAATGVITPVAHLGGRAVAPGNSCDGENAPYDDGPNYIALDRHGDIYYGNDYYQEVDVATNEGTGYVLPPPYAANAPVTPQVSGIVPWHPHKTVRLSDGLSLSIDLNDGHADLSATGMNLPALGPDLALDHTWDSTQALAGITTTAGAGWQDSLTPNIGGVITGTLTYTTETGATWPFTYTGSLTATGPYTTYQTPPGLPWQLSASTSPTTIYTLTNILTGATRTFDAQGRFASDADSYGNSNTLVYSGTVPISLTNTGGRSLGLTFDPATGLLDEASSPLWASGPITSTTKPGQHVTYAYTGTDQLQTLTWGAGTADARSVAFGYAGAELVSVTTPASRTWTIGYDPFGRVVTVTSPASGTVAMQAGYTPAYTTTFTYNPGQTQVVDGLQGADASHALTETHTLDAQGEATAFQDGLGHRSTAQYDQDHDVIISTDANNHATTHAYLYVGPNGSTGLITQTVGPPIAPYTYTNTLTPVITTYGYNPRTYDLTRTVDGNGGITLYGYDAHHSVITTTQLLKIDASGCGTLASVRVRAQPALATRTAHSAAMTSSTCRYIYRWRGSVNTIDARTGHLLATVDGRGITVMPDPSAPDSVVTATLTASASLYKRQWGYDTQGDLTSVSTPPITTTLNGSPRVKRAAVTSYGYDVDGNQTSVTSPNNAKTSYGYDHLGRVVKVTQPSVRQYTGRSSAPVETIGYDQDGNVARASDALGDVTAYSFDPLGRLTGAINPISGTTLLTYTAMQLAAVRDPAGNVTSYQYDLAGRLIGVTDGVGVTRQYAVDAVGNTTAITTPLNASTPQTATVETRGYDAQDEPITDTLTGTGEVTPTPTAAQTTLTSYDYDGNPVQVQAPNGDATYSLYDLADRRYEVDVNPGVVDGPPATAPPASETFTLDEADNLTARFDFYERQHTASFDGDNRAIQWTDSYYARSDAPISTQAGYDPDGNTLALTRTVGSTQTGSYAATYNALDWLTGQDDATGLGPMSYGYDLTGRLRTQTLFGALDLGIQTDTPNPAGWVTQASATITDTGRAPTTDTDTFAYTPDGLPQTTTLNSGGSSARIVETRGYDHDNRLTALQASGPSGVSAPLAASYGYAYDPQGHTSVITAPVLDRDSPDYGTVLTQQLGHNAVGYLTQADGTQWSADGNGNLLGEYPAGGNATTFAYTYTADSATGGITPGNWLPNELAYAKTYDDQNLYYAYDNSGNTTVITDRAAVLTPFTKTIDYDAAGLPTQVTLSDPTLNTSGTSSVTFTYNARGLRVSMAVTPLGQSSPAFSEAFRYRGDQVGQVAVAGTDPFTETFVYRPDGSPLELLFQPRGQATARYWYVLDGQGSVVGLADDTGNLVNTYAYDLWGDHYRGAQDAEAIPQPLRYRGYWHDGWYAGGSVTGGSYAGGQNSFQGHAEDAPLPWYWLRVRWYDPYIRRFLEPDPSAQDGVRGYVYAHDDPVDLSDPSGLAAGGTDSEDVAGEGSVGAPASGGFLNGGATAEPAAPAGAGVQVGLGTLDVPEQLALPYEEVSINSDINSTGTTDALARYVQLELFPTPAGTNTALDVANVSGSEEQRRGPIRWPNGPHNQTIARRIAELEAQGMQHLNGGTLTEESITMDFPNPIKSPRRPDITMRDVDGTLYREQVGRTNAAGEPVPREIGALHDLATQLGTPIYFTPYDVDVLPGSAFLAYLPPGPFTRSTS